MKKIVKYITLLAVTLLATSACDYDDTNFANLTTELDPNATFYVQFKDASKSLKTDVNPDTGALIDISTIVTVGLMGAPQAQDISVNLTVDPSTTLTSNQYTLSSTSVIIPAGQTYGSVDFTRCTRNWDCIPACPADALFKTGYEATEEELIHIVLKDINYYRI